MPRLANRYGVQPSEVARRIRAERERLGLSQAEAARRLGILRPSYRALETIANPQLATLIALVRVLGMDLAVVAPELGSTAPAGVPGRCLSLVRQRTRGKRSDTPSWRPLAASDEALAATIAGSCPAPIAELLRLAAEHGVAVVFRGDLPRASSDGAGAATSS